MPVNLNLTDPNFIKDKGQLLQGQEPEPTPPPPPQDNSLAPFLKQVDQTSGGFKKERVWLNSGNLITLDSSGSPKSNHISFTIADRTDLTSRQYGNLFSSFNYPITNEQKIKFTGTTFANGGFSNTAFSGVGNQNKIVVVDIPKDVLISETCFEYPETVKLPGYNPTYVGHPVQIARALDLLCEAEKPVILSGGGVVSSDASELLVRLAQSLNIPVANTLLGTGSYPGDDPLSLGLTGMHGNYWANLAISECDVLFNIGSRFSDRVTGKLDQYCPKAKIIHVDIDPCSISKNVPVDVPIVGHAKNVLAEMLDAISKKQSIKENKLRTSWLEQILEWKRMRPSSAPKMNKMTPQQVIEKIYQCTKDSDPIIATEVGQHQMWSALLYKFREPRRFITSGGLGTMGFGFPAAMGAQVAYPDRLVIDIAGDGSIQMNIQELATCVEYNIPVKICIINNGYLGMVRQWQERLYNKNYSETLISGPDFVKLAEAYGATGMRVTKEEEIEDALKKAVETEGPVIIDFIVEPLEAVYPWVLAGDPIHKILLNNRD